MTVQKQKLLFLMNQSSVAAKKLTTPAPDSAQLEAILQSAMSAPDHGALTPFRFLIIEGDAREALARVFERAATKRGLDQAAVQKQRSKPLRSPLIICVIACLHEAPSIPETEQLLSAGAAAQHIQLACRALGFGSIWLTGDNSYDLLVYEALGLQLNERVIGFLYVGTPAEGFEQKKRTSAKTITRRWNAPQHTEFAI